MVVAKNNEGVHMHSRNTVGGHFHSRKEQEALLGRDGTMASSDPRQPSAARPYVPPTFSAQDLPPDYASLLAVAFGIAGVMFRHKLGSWLALICCVQSLGNMRSAENDLKQIVMAATFAVMGLVTAYMGPPGTKASKQ